MMPEISENIPDINREVGAVKENRKSSIKYRGTEQIKRAAIYFQMSIGMSA